MAGTTRTVGAKVVLDGEKEYKQALQELNTGNRTLASEMKKLQAEYKGNTESTEYLTKAGDLLNRQLLQQQDKVKTLQEALAAATNQYGEADSRTQKYAQQLNNAEAEEYDLQHAIEENNAALEGQGEEMVGLGDTVEQLAEKFGISIPDGAKEALNGMQGFSAGTAAAMAAAAAAIVAVVEVIKKLGQLTIEVAADVDEYITESAITGVPTEILQAWDYAAPLIDVDAETIKGAMSKITKAMGDAKDGTGASAEAFDRLGISITNEVDGSLKSAEEVFYEVVDALGQMEAGTERDAAAMDLLGKSATDLNPLIDAGSESLKEFAAEAKDVGFILDEYQVKRLGAVDDAYQRLNLTVEAVKKQLAADFAPAAKDAMELFTDVVKKAGEMLERSGIITNLASIIQSLISILRTGGEILTALPGFTNGLDALRVTLGAVAQFCALIADSANLVKSILTLDFTGVKEALGFGYKYGNANNYQRTVMQQNGTWDQYAEFYGRNAGGTDSWRGGLTWVGEAGPELVALPRGSQIYDAQESQQMTAGVTNYYITVNGIEELNQVVNWFNNRQRMERMGVSEWR